MYEIIDHTADIGIKVESSSLEELFVYAADGMFDLMISTKRSLIPSIVVPIAIDAPSLDQLFVRWLQELLYVFERRRLVLMKFWIDRMTHTQLVGAARGLAFDSTRHRQKLDIKAVTYHNLRVEMGEDGLWRAQVVFDI